MFKTFVEDVREFCSLDAFSPESEVRPIAYQEVFLNLFQKSDPKSYREWSDDHKLFFNRVLFNAYELQTTLMSSESINLNKYKNYYCDYAMALARRIQTPLESLLFETYQMKIPEISSDRQKLKKQLYQHIDRAKECRLAWSDLELGTDQKRVLLEEYVLQKGADFLSEGAAMAKVLAGEYGQVQTSLFKIYGDEVGNGNRNQKHSVLFKKMLRSLGVSTFPHENFARYTHETLHITNYFHYLCNNPRMILEYAGALFYAEASTPAFFKKFHDYFYTEKYDIDWAYFKEHIEVDVEHQRIAFEEVIMPLIDIFGNQALIEILRGFYLFEHLAYQCSLSVKRSYMKGFGGHYE